MQLAQALAVLPASQDQPITPQTAVVKRVVSAPVFDPSGALAYWASLVTEQQGSFAQVVAQTGPEARVYLTGARTNRTFYSDILFAATFKELLQVCPQDCRLVYHHQQLYGVSGQTWLRPGGELVTPQEVAEIKRNFDRVRDAVNRSDLPQEMARRWQRLMDESGKTRPLGSQSVSTAGLEPPPLELGQFFSRPAGQVGPQAEGPGECVHFGWWWCNAVQRRGWVANFERGYEFGNKQHVSTSGRVLPQWRWNWNPQPVQHYAAPLQAPFLQGTNTTWGLWDFGAQGLLDKGDRHVTGCGPTSLLRLLNWYRTAGLLNNGSRQVTLRLPNDSLGFSGTTVTIGTSAEDHWQTTQLAQMAFWPVKVRETQGRTFYNAWLSVRMNGHWFVSGQMVLPRDFVGGGNVWLAENNIPLHIGGRTLRDIDWNSLITGVVPVINWLHWSQYTWWVNQQLRYFIGRQDRPMVALYPSGGGAAHYGIARGYRVIEWPDWSANWAVVDNSREGLGSGRGLAEAYLSDFWSTTSGLYFLR